MNISGPSFLLLYVVITIAVNLWLRWHYKKQDFTGGTAHFKLEQMQRLDFANDPYKIALLREGPQEAVKLVIISLVDRGLLQIESKKLQKAPNADIKLARRPIETAVLKFAAKEWKSSDSIASAIEVENILHDYEKELADEGLLADRRIYAKRFSAFIFALSITSGIAALRIIYALSHGRTNVLFLIILAIIAGIALFFAYKKRLTGAGEAMLQKLQKVFARLKQQAGDITPGGENTDAALLAAIFGIGLLKFEFIERLYPTTSNVSNPSGGHSSGFSDGGCSGGSSDSGGGSCGGGCGGCGGCG